MAAGMKDVASLAGVAVGTVSNVLNHPDLVRPLTRARVEAAMEQLGFIPNGSARQLRAGRSRCLGLVVLDVTNPFFTEVARGVEDYAQAAGYAVILCNSDEAHDKERRYLRVLEEQRVRGILITPVHGRSPELRRIRDRGTPVVLLDRPGSPAQCSVAVDDRRGGEIAVSYLLGLGHRSIALVNGPTAIRQCADRRWGAYRAVEHAGLDPEAVLTEVARGAEDFAQAEGYAVILCNSDEAEPKERQYLRVLEEQRVRGILITPVHGPVKSPVESWVNVKVSTVLPPTCWLLVIMTFESV